MQHSGLHKHAGGCHCGNIRVVVEITAPPAAATLRACGCSFCRAHGVRTVTDPAGAFKIWAQDWDDVTRYRFETATADFLICSRCGVYVGAVCETAAGPRGVANINALNDRALFTAAPQPMNYDGEDAPARLARRAQAWMPAVIHT